ncbi:MAG: hypothetical protein LEGION0398_MBIBDBAK_01390 [Legionellaceae bacterium]
MISSKFFPKATMALYSEELKMSALKMHSVVTPFDLIKTLGK